MTGAPSNIAAVLGKRFLSAWRCVPCVRPLRKEKPALSAFHPRPWRRGSLFGTGPRRSLDRNDRARFGYLLETHYRARRISAKQERVGRALLKRLGADGRCDPCYDTLGADAGCSARTARRATTAMHRLGLLSWQTRLVRSGWRAEQTSNAYELLTTTTPPALVSCGGQNGRETKNKYLSASEEDVAARANAIRQLVALGMAVPRSWQQ